MSSSSSKKASVAKQQQQSGKPKYNEKVEAMMYAAERGNTEAMGMCGEWFANGVEGVEKNLKTARMWYRRAADLGNGRAMMKLGVLYRDGRGVKHCGAVAADMFQRAGEHNCPAGFASLANCYLSGVGVKQNESTALHWFRQGFVLANRQYSFCRWCWC
jgi:hypothetical protein